MAEEAVLGAFLGIFGIIILGALACFIIVLIGQYKVYTKAGEKGWKCLIPYYNFYTECKFVGLDTNWVWVLLGGTFLAGVLDGIIGVDLFSTVAYVLTFYFNVIKSVSIAKSFGKEPAYAVGLIMIPFVFYPMLGFGNSKYIGPTPCKDWLFKNNKVPNVPVAPQQPVAPQTTEDQILNGTMPQQPAPQQPVAQKRFCTNCGSEIADGNAFCTSCGTKAN